MAADRFNVNLSVSKNWEHLKTKVAGSGHPNMTKQEWGINIQRDTLASHIGHADQMEFFATVENESVHRIKRDMLDKLVSGNSSTAKN